ncbi:MAG TPA: histidine kinase dimerization/phospho-acceptor domain-containing protein [Planctomycetaceae bacterium]|jgi:K+-sensing histidine kinase KdpD|nr:histidine kinase dimerization/phospho-acceptor domain-containing protein [Planctomycetaceae bacterium]
MAIESAAGLKVRELEGRFQLPRPGLRSLEPIPETLGNTQPEGELREANRKMREYLAELGHDLRTPLAAICDALHVLSLEGDDGATREFVGDLMERQTQRIGRLVDDLFEASRLGHGKIRLCKEQVAAEKSVFGQSLGRVRENTTKHPEQGQDQVYKRSRETHL